MAAPCICTKGFLVEPPGRRCVRVCAPSAVPCPRAQRHCRDLRCRALDGRQAQQAAQQALSNVKQALANLAGLTQQTLAPFQQQLADKQQQQPQPPQQQQQQQQAPSEQDAAPSLPPSPSEEWESWCGHFEAMDAAGNLLDGARTQLTQAVATERYADAAELSARCRALEDGDAVAVVRAELGAALREERYADAAALRDDGWAWLAGWWAGQGEGDPHGHLLHVTAEYGRWTGKVYTPRDLAELKGWAGSGEPAGATMFRFGRTAAAGFGGGGGAAARTGGERGTGAGARASLDDLGAPILEVFLRQGAHGRGGASAGVNAARAALASQVVALRPAYADAAGGSAATTWRHTDGWGGEDAVEAQLRELARYSTTDALGGAHEVWRPPSTAGAVLLMTVCVNEDGTATVAATSRGTPDAIDADVNAGAESSQAPSQRGGEVWRQWPRQTEGAAVHAAAAGPSGADLDEAGRRLELTDDEQALVAYMTQEGLWDSSDVAEFVAQRYGAAAALGADGVAGAVAAADKDGGSARRGEDAADTGSSGFGAPAALRLHFDRRMQPTVGAGGLDAYAPLAVLDGPSGASGDDDELLELHRSPARITVLGRDRFVLQPLEEPSSGVDAADAADGRRSAGGGGMRGAAAAAGPSVTLEVEVPLCRPGATAGARASWERLAEDVAQLHELRRAGPGVPRSQLVYAIAAAAEHLADGGVVPDARRAARVTEVVTDARGARPAGAAALPGSGRITYTRIPTDQPKTDPFTGLYLGAFGPHGPELLSLSRGLSEDGEEEVVGVKLTGDANVPAGAVSFRAKVGRRHRLDSRDVYPDELGVVARFRGEGRVAEPGFRNARGVEGELLQFSASASPLLTCGAQLGFVWTVVRNEKRFLILLNRVHLDE